MRKGIFLKLITALVVIAVLDIVVFRQVLPNVPKFVSGKINSVRSSVLNSDTSDTAFLDNQGLDVDTSQSIMTKLYPKFTGTDEKLPDEQTLNEEDIAFRKELKKLGYEAAEDHEFKSPYIVTPLIHPKRYRDEPIMVSRKTKVISCFNCEGWFNTSSITQHHRDFKDCPYSECSFDGQGKYKKTADVLLFLVGKLGKGKVSVPSRPPGQIWVKSYWESPVNYEYPKNYETWKGVFNWTFNYRLDSDIFASGLLAWRDRDLLLSDEEYIEIAKRKTKTAAWFVSNCKVQSKREDYVKKMQKYIDVDIFGKCSKRSCSRSENAKCEQMLTDTYKFYLSFENSICKDYVTEKFIGRFRSRTYIIPVGRGGFEYDKYFPPGGFVNAANFKTPKELALHLKKLGDDLPTYAQMLKEKDKLLGINRTLDWCDVCEKLHTNTENKIIPDIKAWSHDGACHPPNDLK